MKARISPLFSQKWCHEKLQSLRILHFHIHTGRFYFYFILLFSFFFFFFFFFAVRIVDLDSILFSIESFSSFQCIYQIFLPVEFFWCVFVSWSFQSVSMIYASTNGKVWYTRRRWEQKMKGRKSELKKNWRNQPLVSIYTHHLFDVEWEQENVTWHWVWNENIING